MSTYLRAALKLLDPIHSEPIRWWRSMGRCPCYKKQLQTWDTTHALCNGTGSLLVEQDTAGRVAQITDYQERQGYDQGTGMLQQGDLLASVWEDDFPLGEGDQILVPSRWVRDSETLIRGFGVTGNADALRQTNVIEILAIYTPAGPVTGGFNLDTDQVVWTGTEPTDRYRVLYRYNPRFQVIAGSILHRMPDPDGGRLPLRVGLRMVQPNQIDPRLR